MSKRSINDSSGDTSIAKRPSHSNDLHQSDADSSNSSLSQSSGNLKAPKRPADSGTIIEVSLRNFMFHERLEFKFCDRVNFVIGKNGSGKSAVQTAIVVALGGKATATGRGSTVKNFIKHGKNSCAVMVRLKNDGADSYKADIYGETIMVERRINSDGTSTYSLKNHQGVVISRKKEELEHILDQFNIQVDNPIVIMSQDTSRNFLPSVGGPEKYKFFLQGTQLQQIQDDYNALEQSMSVSKDIVRKKKQAQNILEEEVHRLEEKYEAISQLDNLKNNVEALKKDLAWAFVTQEEKELDLAVKEQSRAELGTPKFEKRVQEKKDELAKTQEAITSILEKMKEQQKEVELQMPALEKQKKIKDDLGAKLRKHAIELKKLENESRSYKTEHQQISQRINNIKETAHTDYEKECKELEESIKKLEEEASALTAKKKSTEHDREQHRHAVGHCQKEFQKLQGEERQLKQGITQQRRLLATYKSSEQDTMNKYGQNMGAVVRDIQQQRDRFHKLPRGPLGAHMKLTDMRWAVSVERCLGNWMLSFTCHDHHDEIMLEKIFRKHLGNNRKPSIITSHFLARQHDVSQGRVYDPSNPCVIDVLDVDDHIVMNCLIDQSKIDTVMLFESSRVAKEVMSRGSIPKLAEAYTMSGDQIYCRPTYRYYSCAPNFKARYLTASLQEDIRQAEGEISKIQAELNEINPAIKRTQRDIAENETKCRTAHKVIDTLSRKLADVEMQIHLLKDKELPAPPNIDSLEQDKKEASDHIERIAVKIQSSSELVAEINKEFKVAKKLLNELDANIAKIGEETDPLEDELGKKENMLAVIKGHKTHYEAKLKDHNKMVQNLQKAVKTQRESVEKTTADAQQICAERTTTRRTAQNLSSEIEQIQRRINAESKIRGNKEDIIRRYTEKKDSFTQMSMDINNISSYLDRLRIMLSERKGKYKEFTMGIIGRIRYFFTMLLHSKDYTGKINFDSDRKTLTFTVNTKQHKTKDMKALSGGEKSFTTICFVLALWDMMECPFRCLDEFDVFQDMVNRRMSLDMILSTALGRDNGQFLFLTPQPMNLCANDAVKIFKMADPDRTGNGNDPPQN